MFKWLVNHLVKGWIEATSFITTGGTSSQFVKGDGSLDGTTYAVDSNVIHTTGDETKTGVLTLNDHIVNVGSETLAMHGAADYELFNPANGAIVISHEAIATQTFIEYCITLLDNTNRLVATIHAQLYQNNSQPVGSRGGATVYSNTDSFTPIIQAAKSPTGDICLIIGADNQSFGYGNVTLDKVITSFSGGQAATWKDGWSITQLTDTTSFTNKVNLSPKYLASRDWVQSQNYLTSVNLNGYATESWVNSNFDNYQSWNLKTNGVQRTTIQSGGTLDLIAGTNTSLQYGAGGQVTINSSFNDTTYTAGTGLDLTGTEFSFDTAWGDGRYLNHTGSQINDGTSINDYINTDAKIETYASNMLDIPTTHGGILISDGSSSSNTFAFMGGWIYDELFWRTNGNTYQVASRDWVTTQIPTTPTLNQVTNAGNVTNSPIIYDTGSGSGGSAIVRRFSNTTGGYVRFLGTIENTESAAGTIPFGIGVYGTSITDNYAFLGYGDYNDTNNLRIYPNGTLRAGNSLIWNEGNDGTGSGLDADLLDGEHGSYYLNYNNFTNAPTIPTVNNNTITISPQGILTGGGSFNLNQGSNETLNITAPSFGTTAGTVAEGNDIVRQITYDFNGLINIRKGDGTAISSDRIGSIRIGDARSTDDFPNSDGTTGYMPTPTDSIWTDSVNGIFSYDWNGNTNSWGSILTVKGWQENHSAWQISGASTSSDTIDENFYLRNSNPITNTWNPWLRIWHSGDFDKNDFLSTDPNSNNPSSANFQGDLDTVVGMNAFWYQTGAANKAPFSSAGGLILNMRYPNGGGVQISSGWDDEEAGYRSFATNGTPHQWHQFASRDWSNSQFSLQNHTHSASDITSGTFPYSRLPISAAQVSNWGDAYTHSNITTGNPHNIGYGDLQGTQPIPTLQEVITEGSTLNVSNIINITSTNVFEFQKILTGGEELNIGIGSGEAYLQMINASSESSAVAVDTTGIKLRSPDDNYARLETSLLSAERTYQFPDASGTLALTSNLIDSLSDLSDVNVTGAEEGDILVFNGEGWLNQNAHVDSGWQTVAENSTNVDTAITEVWCKTIGDKLIIKGTVGINSGVTTGDHILTLPVGYRPDVVRHTTITKSIGRTVESIQINTDGTIDIGYTTAGAFIHFIDVELTLNIGPH